MTPEHDRQPRVVFEPGRFLAQATVRQLPAVGIAIELTSRSSPARMPNSIEQLVTPSTTMIRHSPSVAGVYPAPLASRRPEIRQKSAWVLPELMLRCQSCSGVGEGVEEESQLSLSHLTERRGLGDLDVSADDLRVSRRRYFVCKRAT